jgi:2-polyprenyl-6-methoxyphenol hydroxylase-like FAD-dependent oxidoreductase
MTVLIAGLAMGLTLHQIGAPFRIFERVKVPQPPGVGINLQPTAVRVLFALDLAEHFDEIGVRTRDYGFYTRTGVMQIAEDQCGGDFSKLDTLLPMAERAAHAGSFKEIAGPGVAQTNAQSGIL